MTKNKNKVEGSIYDEEVIKIMCENLNLDFKDVKTAKAYLIGIYSPDRIKREEDKAKSKICLSEFIKIHGDSEFKELCKILKMPKINSNNKLIGLITKNIHFLELKRKLKILKKIKFNLSEIASEYVMSFMTTKP